MSVENMKAIIIDTGDKVTIISPIFNIHDCALQVATMDDDGRLGSQPLSNIQLIQEFEHHKANMRLLDWVFVGQLDNDNLYVSALKHTLSNIALDQVDKLSSRWLGDAQGRLPTINEAKFIFQHIGDRFVGIGPIWTKTPSGSSRYVYDPDRGPIIADITKSYSCLSVLSL
jgi:hypothetical protein